jgi:hypothetical protein
VMSVDDRLSHGAAALGTRPPDGRFGFGSGCCWEPSEVSVGQARL